MKLSPENKTKAKQALIEMALTCSNAFAEYTEPILGTVLVCIEKQRGLSLQQIATKLGTDKKQVWRMTKACA